VDLKVATQYVEHIDEERVPNGVEHLVAFLAAGDDILGPQDPKMLGCIRLLQPEPFDDLTGRQLPVPELFDDRSSGRVRKGLEYIRLELAKRSTAIARREGRA
jgi:hypothetical protein